MIKVNITGYECIFDSDADTRHLYVTETESGYKKLRYSRGYYAGQYYSRVLLEVTIHLQVDHINGNPLDNRKCNLRLVTRVQNLANQVASRAKKSKLPKGITLVKQGKFQARLSFKGSPYNFGTFLTIKEAKEAYEKGAAKIQGKYSLHLSRPTSLR